MSGCNYCTTNFTEVVLVLSFISILFSLTNMKNVQFNLTSCESNLFLKFKQWDKICHHPIIWSDKTNFWLDIVCWPALISRPVQKSDVYSCRMFHSTSQKEYTNQTLHKSLVISKVSYFDLMKHQLSIRLPMVVSITHM